MKLRGIYDIHAHLNDVNYIDLQISSNAIVKEAATSGVDFINNVGYDIKSSKTAIIQANKDLKVFATVGIHPTQAHLYTKEAFKTLKQIAGNPEVVAIGETGLDYSRTSDYVKEQKKAFEEQIKISKTLDLPLMLHVKDVKDSFKAYEDCLKLVKKYNIKKAVVHSYEGNMHYAEEFIKLGLYISINGAITYDKNLQAIVKKVSLNSLMVESDAPYTSPTPYENQINFPKYLPLTIEKIAKLKNMNPNDIVESTTSNAKKIFIKK